MEANMAGLKEEMSRAQEDIENRRKSLLQEQESIGTAYQPDSQEFKQKQESLISRESKTARRLHGQRKRVR